MNNEIKNEYGEAVKKQYTQGLTLSYLLVSLTLLVLIPIYGIKLFNSAHETQIDYQFMIANWKTDFIDSIYKVPAGGSCKKGDEFFYNYKFQGTVQGCKCDDSEEVKPGPCCNQKAITATNIHSKPVSPAQNKTENFGHSNLVNNVDIKKLVHHAIQENEYYQERENQNHSIYQDMINFQKTQQNLVQEHDQNQKSQIPEHTRVHDFGFSNPLLDKNLCHCYGTQIPKTGSINMNTWANVDTETTPGYILCVQRIKGYNLFSKGIYQEEQCKPNEKVCGEPTGSQTTFCIPQNHNCPMSHLKIANEYPEGTDWDGEIVLGDGFSLFTSTSVDAYPMVEIRVSEGPGVCLRNVIFNQDPEKPLYPLWNTQLEDCQGVDPRFEEIGSINEETFLRINKADQILHQLPNYPETNQKNQVKIFGRRVIELSIKCRELLPKFQLVLDDIQELFNYIKLTSTFSILLFFFYLGIFGLNLYLLSHLNTDFDWYAPTIYQRRAIFRNLVENQSQSEGESNRNYKTLWFRFQNIQYITIIIQFCLTILLFTLHINSSNIKTFSYNFLHSQCSDKLMEDIIIDIGQGFDSTYLTRLIWCFFLTVVIDPNYSYPLKCIWCQKNQEEDVKQKEEVHEQFEDYSQFNDNSIMGTSKRYAPQFQYNNSNFAIQTGNNALQDSKFNSPKNDFENLHSADSNKQGIVFRSYVNEGSQSDQPISVQPYEDIHYKNHSPTQSIIQPIQNASVINSSSNIIQSSYQIEQQKE